MIKLGWIDWNGEFGPSGRLWADDEPLPTVIVWDNTPRNPEDSTDRYNVEGVFPLENGLTASVLVNVDEDGLWRIDMSLFKQNNPLAKNGSGWWPVEIVHVPGEVAAIYEDDGRMGTWFDPEDGEQLKKALRHWSNLEIVDKRSSDSDTLDS
jgi:hypothetical protein